MRQTDSHHTMQLSCLIWSMQLFWSHGQWLCKLMSCTLIKTHCNNQKLNRMVKLTHPHFGSFNGLKKQLLRWCECRTPHPSFWNTVAGCTLKTIGPRTTAVPKLALNVPPFTGCQRHEKWVPAKNEILRQSVHSICVCQTSVAPQPRTQDCLHLHYFGVPSCLDSPNLRLSMKFNILNSGTRCCDCTDKVVQHVPTWNNYSNPSGRKRIFKTAGNSSRFPMPWGLVEAVNKILGGERLCTHFSCVTGVWTAGAMSSTIWHSHHFFLLVVVWWIIGTIG